MKDAHQAGRMLIAGFMAVAVSLSGCGGDMEAAPEVEREAQERPFTLSVDEMDFGPCPDFIPEGCEVAFIQGDPEQPNADVVFRLAPNTTIPNHMHTSAERMVLTSGEFHIDYDGHDPVVMTAGTYAYGPAGVPHTAYCAEGAECHLFVAFVGPVDAIPVE